jgi:hypothetical protein
MSIMLTSSSDDVAIIKKVIDITDFLTAFVDQNITINLPDCNITSEDIQKVNSYFLNIHSILTTSGMSYDDYKNSLTI